MLLKKSLAYIELKNEVLILGVLTDLKEKFVFQNINFINLDRLDYYQDVIYNPSKILYLTKKFIKDNNLLNTIVCLPALEKKEDKEQKLFLLQNLLVLGQLNLNIKKIIDKSLIKKESNQSFLLKNDINNAQDYYKKNINLSLNNSAFCNWLKIVFISIFIVIFFLVFFSFKKIKNFNNFLQENINIENRLLESKNIVKDLNNIKDKTNREFLFFNKIKKINNTLNIPDELLLNISQNLPEYTWLRTIKIDKKNLEIYGQSLGQNNIAIFTQKLAKLNGFKSIKLENIEQADPEQDKFIEHLKDREVYNFKIKVRC